VEHWAEIFPSLATQTSCIANGAKQ